MNVAIRFRAISNVATFALAEVYRVKIVTNSTMRPPSRDQENEVILKSSIPECNESLGKQVMKIAPPQK